MNATATKIRDTLQRWILDRRVVTVMGVTVIGWNCYTATSGQNSWLRFFALASALWLTHLMTHLVWLWRDWDRRDSPEHILEWLKRNATPIQIADDDEDDETQPPIH